MVRTSDPKVLILFETFHLNSGGGITLTNLFKNWDKASIANSTFSYALNDCFNNQICLKYYSFGSSEIKNNHFYRIFFNIGVSGEIVAKLNSFNEYNKRNKPSTFFSTIKLYIKSILNIFGFETNSFSYSLRVSPEYLAWVKEFNPDVIYAQPSSKATCLFIEELHKKTRIPIVLHIMDDWILTYRNGLFNKLMNSQIHEIFLKLLNSSRALFTISEGMRNAYKERYGKESMIFHNTIDIDNWKSFAKKKFELGDPIRILYAGRIGIGTYHSLLEVVKAAEELAFEGCNLKIHIQSLNIDERYKKKLLTSGIVKINTPVDYQKLPLIFSSYDILLIPIDFSKKGKQFLKYSMPTKVPEFMISGTPICIYAPTDVYLHKHAIEHKWAYIIGENSKEAIKKGLNELMSNQKLRAGLSARAYKYALDNYDEKKIRSKFKNALMDIGSLHNS